MPSLELNSQEASILHTWVQHALDDIEMTDTFDQADEIRLALEFVTLSEVENRLEEITQRA